MHPTVHPYAKREHRELHSGAKTIKYLYKYSVTKELPTVFLVEMELDKKLLQSLKSKHPEKWEELYKCYQDNDRLGYLQLLDEEPALDVRPISKQVKPKSSFAKAFTNS